MHSHEVFVYTTSAWRYFFSLIDIYPRADVFFSEWSFRGENRKKRSLKNQINIVVKLLTIGLSKTCILRPKIGTASVCIASSSWWAPSIFYWICTHLESWRLHCWRLHSAMTVIAIHTQHHGVGEAGTHPSLLRSTCWLGVGDFPQMCSSSIVLSVREGWAALSLSITLRIEWGDLCLVNGPFYWWYQTFWHQRTGTVLFLLAKGSRMVFGNCSRLT